MTARPNPRAPDVKFLLNWNGARKRTLLLALRTLLLALLLPLGCSSSPSTSACPRALAAHPTGAAWTAPPDDAAPVAVTFSLTIDPQHPALSSAWRQPQAAPLTIGGGGQGLRLTGGVKTFASDAGRLYLELYVVNDAASGLRGVTLQPSVPTHASAFYDLMADPLGAATGAPGPLAVGGIGPEGVSARIRLAVDGDGSGAPITMTLALAGATTARVSATSAPLALSPAGGEVWAGVPDADRVAVVDTASDARSASLAVAGRPSSVAITPDGKLVLVACATCNQLVVVDRATRAVTQIFGEAEGIGREPRNVVVAPDGTRAYVSAYVGDTVTVLERRGDAFAVTSTIPTGRRPVGMSLPPDGRTLYVAHFLPHGPIEDNGGWVSVLDTDAAQEIGTAELRDDGNVAEASCLTKVQAFASQSAEALSFEASPTQLAGVFLSPGGGEGWVPALRVAGFPILEGDVSALGFQFATLGANSPMMLFPLDTRAPRAAAFRRASSVIDITDRDASFLACYPGLDDVEAVRAEPGASENELEYAGVTIPSQATMLSESGASRFVGWTRGGRRALVLSYLADELVVLDAASHSPTTRRHFTLAGSNPTGIVVTPDGTKGYVSYENSPFVSVLDLSAYAVDGALPEPAIVPYRLDPGAPAGQGAAIITFLMLVRGVDGVPDLPPVTETAEVALVDADPMDPTLRRGRILFTSSNPDKYPTLTGSREAACAACHPNGGNDGSAWSTMEGERRTLGLWGGVGTRGWLHASATHRSAVDFATSIVKERLGGSGLDDGDVAALSSYLARGIPIVQRPATDAALVARGKTLFDAHCLGCHAGPDGGGGNADAADPYGGGAAGGPSLANVGSATDWAHVTLGEAYTHLFPPTARDVLNLLRGDRDLGDGDAVQQTLMFDPRPNRQRGSFKPATLVDVWENGVFLHDARFTSLDDVVAYFDTQLGLGLGADDQRALVEYLKSR